jgi:hypothetical protein
MAMTPWQAQLIHRVNQRFIKEASIIMAKQEIVKRTADPLRNLWWRFMPGAKITVAWPTGWTVPEPAPGGGFNSTKSADPNDHFRPWLEANVGRQGWDWDWRMGPTTGAMGGVGKPTIFTGDYLVIKFRRGREKYATMFTLIWQ